MLLDHLDEDFAAAMARLGPYGPRPKFCVAVSGGADSMALALLARNFVGGRNGDVLGLIVDHGLRPGSAAEAAVTQDRLAAQGILARVLTIAGLRAGAPGMQAMARTARYDILAGAARDAGAVFLLFGHHAADQAETVTMRAARGDFGLEGMAGWAARDNVILLRPLLGVAPKRLRAFLAAAGIAWVEDPANADRRFERVRVRQDGANMTAGAPDARVAGERAAADFLARNAVLRPEGFAVIRADTAPPAALAALLRVVGGADYPPARDAVARLASRLKPASLGGVVLARTAKYGGGWLLAREFAACAPPVPAQAGRVWDRRFRLLAGMANATLGALGADCVAYRDTHPLPAAVLRGMPCLRRGDAQVFPAPVRFAPPGPACPHPFVA